MSENNDGKVGYKRPPRSSQFRPGESGNPSGKAKGTRNISTELRDILNEQITFASDGALKTMSKQRALASALVSAAISGDLRATAIVMAHLTRDLKNLDDTGAGEDDDFQAARAHRQRKSKLK